MDNAQNETEDYNFGKEMAKVFAINAAASVGGIAGLCVVGYAVGKFLDVRNKRNAKKTNLKAV